MTGCATSESAVRPEVRSARGSVEKVERTEAAEVLPFVHDDYARALAEAKRTKRPIFVDAWAPWCHSCLSMRAYVLTDPTLAPLAKDFVWLTIDTEKDSNGAFVSRFGNRVWPTLWVIDGESERTILRWEGTATAPELLTLLATVREGGGATKATEATVMFMRANQAASRGDLVEAERGYRDVIAQKDFHERPRALEALVGLLASKNDHAACAELAIAEAPHMPPGTSRATLLATGLSCAREGKREADMAKLADAVERAANDADPRTIADDRSALFEELVEAKKDRGDEAGAKATARAWASFLEQAASRAPTKQARAVFDPHRLSAYLAAGEPERAIPMLTESERDFPDDYNPPARLARAYLTAKRLDDARAAIERAGTRVYGPRSLRIFDLAADIAKARGDVAAERAALEQGLARTTHVVLNENQKKLRASLEKRLHELHP
ncbi:MAG: Chromosome partition protein smc [Myxococcaceae bacterium]|nr:Chromosome partition protein smc [Myxococcaceae bacterium]